MSNHRNETTVFEITKRVVISILFSSVSLGLLGGSIMLVKASANPIPLILFGVVSGVAGGVLANLSKIREVRELRALSLASNNR